jgi:hypothetical protein
LRSQRPGRTTPLSQRRSRFCWHSDITGPSWLRSALDEDSYPSACRDSRGHHLGCLSEIHAGIWRHGAHEYEQRAGHHQLSCLCRLIATPMGGGCPSWPITDAAHQFHVPEESHRAPGRNDLPLFDRDCCERDSPKHAGCCLQHLLSAGEASLLARPDYGELFYSLCPRSIISSWATTGPTHSTAGITARCQARTSSEEWSANENIQQLGPGDAGLRLLFIPESAVRCA